MIPHAGLFQDSAIGPCRAPSGFRQEHPLGLLQDQVWINHNFFGLIINEVITMMMSTKDDSSTRNVIQHSTRNILQASCGTRCEHFGLTINEVITMMMSTKDDSSTRNVIQYSTRNILQASCGTRCEHLWIYHSLNYLVITEVINLMMTRIKVNRSQLLWSNHKWGHHDNDDN